MSTNIFHDTSCVMENVSSVSSVSSKHRTQDANTANFRSFVDLCTCATLE